MVGIFRKVAASLAATTKLTFVRDVLDPAEVGKSNKTEGWIELRNGSRIWFLGLDPDPVTGVPSKVGSLDLTFAFVDEAVEVTEGDWIMLLGRLRHPGAAWTQIAGATNPADPTHWLKQRFAGDSERRQYLHARTHDNTLLPNDYLERMEDVAAGVFRSRYVEGEWVSISGDIFRSEWFKTAALPPDVIITRRVGVDLASSTKTHADFTAVVEVAEDHEMNLYVVGAWRAKIDYGHRQWLLEGPPHLANGRTFARVNVEAVAFQSAFFTELVNTTSLPAVPIHPDRDKVSRSMALAARFNAGKVWFVPGAPGIDELKAELLGFPGGAHDDLVDALVYAADLHAGYSGNQFSMIA